VGVVDDIQMTTTLICLDLQLLHHFIEGTDIDTDINSGTSGICTVQLFNSLYYCLAFLWSTLCL
jgi:hypothetical protein